MSAPEPDLGRLIDRLVDDELDPAARRDLLARLDSVPGGWRRCACAFLEAQAWRAAVAPTGHEGAPPESPPARPWRRALRTAAGVLAAFALGWAARSETPSTRTAVTVAPPAARPAPAQSPVPPAAPRRERQETGLARAEPAPGAAKTRAAASPLPEAVRRRLRQRGFEVEEKQRLLAVGLQNGRSVAVPVEELKVRYVGKRTL
jgi:hypothetical protein